MPAQNNPSQYTTLVQSTPASIPPWCSQQFIVCFFSLSRFYQFSESSNPRLLSCPAAPSLSQTIFCKRTPRWCWKMYHQAGGNVRGCEGVCVCVCVVCVWCVWCVCVWCSYLVLFLQALVSGLHSSWTRQDQSKHSLSGHGVCSPLPPFCPQSEASVHKQPLAGSP